ncbi:MAG: ISKra4 family transposase [Solirubrobacteraceae bacterium]
MTTEEQERLIDAVLTRYRAVLRQRLRDEPQTLDEIERAVEDISQVMDDELERRLLEHKEQPAVPEDNQAACPDCGGWGRYRSTDARQLVTRHGEHTLARRRYYCRRCRQGFVPLDQQLGLDRGATSLQVRLWVTEIAPRAAIGEGNGLLERLTGVKLGASTFARIAVHVGTALRAAEREAAKQHQAGHPPPVLRKPQRLYFSVDGIFAPLRDPWKKDGSLGPLHCRAGECKTAAVYEAEAGPQGDEGVAWRGYTATFADAAAFAPLVGALAHRAGHHFAQEVVFLADGQAYNWTLAASQFPTSVQIVDFQHAVAHLFVVAHACLGAEPAVVEPWVEARKAELLDDQVGAVITAVAALTPHTAEQREAQAREGGYFTHNAERMRYKTFLKHGYQIATGVMEAACKQVVHQRLDQVGMHWRPETAEAFVALRAALLSSAPPDLRPYCRMAH